MKTNKLFLILFLFYISIEINAQSTYVEIDDYYYNLSDSTATLTHKKYESNCYFGNVSIPQEIIYNGNVYVVTCIGESAFSNCTAVASISIPESITNIENKAFEGCTALLSIEIPGNVTTIGSEIFKGCSNLKNVTFCDGDEELNIHKKEWTVPIFKDCPIKKIYLGRNIKYSGEESFILRPETGHLGLFSSSLESVTFGEDVTTICYMAFAGCKKLNIIDFPHNITKIGKGAFAECTSLNYLELDNPNLLIDDCAFWYCTSLNNISINIPVIGLHAFDWCKGLQELHLGNLVTKIGGGAFENCKNMKKVYCLAKNPPTTDKSNSDNGDGKTVFQYEYRDDFGELAWRTYNQEVELYVPDISIDAYNSVEPWKNFKSIEGIHIPIESIILDSQEISMILKSTIRLSSTVYPDNASNQDVIWSSSNDDVVTVENGLLTAKGEGEAVIYATSKDNPDIKAECIVHVIIPVNGITLVCNNPTIKVGESSKIDALISPLNASNKNILWYSSNEKVCKVNDGIVTAEDKGFSIITAVTEDGEYHANCTITVIRPVTGISLSQDNCKLNSIGESIQLKAFVSPENASNLEVNWNSSDENVCIVSNGTVVAVGYGTCVIIATTSDGGYIATCTITVLDTTGIDNVNIISDDYYKVYTIEGKPTTLSTKGVKLIKFNNGTTQKVLIK